MEGGRVFKITNALIVAFKIAGVYNMLLIIIRCERKIGVDAWEEYKSLLDFFFFERNQRRGRRLIYIVVL